MTKVIYGPEECHMRIDGHAGFVQNGMDPVCAGISALGFTLLAAAEEEADYHLHLYASQKEGVLDIQCFPTEEAAERCRYLFHVIQAGIDLISEEFPDYLKTIGGAKL